MAADLAAAREALKALADERALAPDAAGTMWIIQVPDDVRVFARRALGGDRG